MTKPRVVCHVISVGKLGEHSCGVGGGPVKLSDLTRIDVRCSVAEGPPHQPRQATSLSNTQRLTLETSMVSARTPRIGGQNGVRKLTLWASRCDPDQLGRRGFQLHSGRRALRVVARGTRRHRRHRRGIRSELRRPVTITKNLCRVGQLRATSSDAFQHIWRRFGAPSGRGDRRKCRQAKLSAATATTPRTRARTPPSVGQNGESRSC